MWRGNKSIGMVIAVAVTLAAPAAAQNNEKPSRLTIEHLVDIKHPSNPIWSPDG